MPPSATEAVAVREALSPTLTARSSIAAIAGVAGVMFREQVSVVVVVVLFSAPPSSGLPSSAVPASTVTARVNSYRPATSGLPRR